MQNLLRKYPQNLPVRLAADLMGKPQMFVRCGLKAKELPFGSAVKMEGGRYSYYICTRQFIKFIGGEINETD